MFACECQHIYFHNVLICFNLKWYSPDMSTLTTYCAVLVGLCMSNTVVNIIFSTILSAGRSGWVWITQYIHQLQQADLLVTGGSVLMVAPTVNPLQSSRVGILPCWKKVYMPLVKVSNASLTFMFSFVDTLEISQHVEFFSQSFSFTLLTCRPTARSHLWPTSTKNIGLGFT